MSLPPYEVWKRARPDGLRDRCSFCCDVVWAFRPLYRLWREAGGFTACGICYAGLAREQEAERRDPARTRLPVLAMIGP